MNDIYGSKGRTYGTKKEQPKVFIKETIPLKLNQIDMTCLALANDWYNKNYINFYDGRYKQYHITDLRKLIDTFMNRIEKDFKNHLDDEKYWRGVSRVSAIMTVAVRNKMIEYIDEEIKECEKVKGVEPSILDDVIQLTEDKLCLF